MLHNAYIIDGVKISVMSSIDMMVKSWKRIILEKSDEKLKIPFIILIEDTKGITE